MNLGHYVFIDSTPVFPGAGLILCTSSPHHIGKVLKLKRSSDYDDFLSKADYPVGKVDKYRVCILYAGTLSGNASDLKPIQTILDDMADWYLENKIKRTPHGFKHLLRTLFS